MVEENSELNKASEEELESSKDDLDMARRKMLKLVAYSVPAIVSVVAVRSADAAPKGSCNPGTCGPAPCNPSGGPCTPTEPPPKGGPNKGSRARRRR